MMDLLHDISIRCNTCGLLIPFLSSELEPVVGDYDHGDNAMGIETLYTISHSFSCPICASRIEFSIIGSEYPLGAYNGTYTTIYGASFSQEPRMGITDYDESDFFPYWDNISPMRQMMIDICYKPDLLWDSSRISPRDFEFLIAQLFKDEGYTVEVTKQTRDGGVDIIATKPEIGGDTELWIECKRFAPNHKVGREYVDKLLGVLSLSTANKGIIVTTSFFTYDAKNRIDECGARLGKIDGTALFEWIKKNVRAYYRGELN